MGDLTKIEAHIIKKVKDLRIEAGLSQIVLSQKLGMSDSFVGHVETPKRRAKYNINHINSLAKVFKCSPKDFWPEKALWSEFCLIPLRTKRDNSVTGSHSKEDLKKARKTITVVFFEVQKHGDFSTVEYLKLKLPRRWNQLKFM
jgi:transcriptional regulator with XRE-family HTH domain